MRKKIGNKFISLSVSTPDGKELAPKLKALVWDYLNGMRPYDPNDKLDLAAYMLYCSYVSRNAEDLGLEDFDFDYTIDEVLGNLGNKYLASDFVNYYAGLNMQSAVLPDLRDLSFDTRDLSKAITNWISALNTSKLSLMENDEGGAASAIFEVLAEAMASDAWGRTGGEHSSPLPVSNLVVKLADVKGKDVFDFACGNGIYLAKALTCGAKSATGKDINIRAVARASIMCFFADTQHVHDVRVANALTKDPNDKPVKRVLVAPPLGMPLREYDIPEKDYYTETLDSLIGEGSPRPQTFEDFCVAKALASLENDGIAVLHVSASFLFHQQKGREAVRHAIVEKGYLRTVIELPGGCVPGATTKSALLVLRKAPTDSGVLIVDLDSKEIAGKGYVVKGRGKCEITDAGIEWLVNMVCDQKEIPLVSTIADRETILSSGSNLCYSAYGSVYDFQSVLDQTRTTADIVGDMQSAQATIEDLGTRIDDLLLALGKGRN